MILKALKEIILCAVRKKIKELNENFLKTKRSLLPPFINDTINTVEGLLGKAENTVDKARGFTDKINLDSLNNVNLFNKKGRFCE
jgi:glutamate mutase epsilon subunit